MKALYRKYRPLKLDEVVGQEQVTRPLINALGQEKINHAYLFTGPRGTGKTSVARIFAHEINKFDYSLEDDYTDIVEIDGASNRGIDDIREIREKAMIKPTLGKYKVYIIDEVHMLTREAFNALLKTLEEPPAHVIFIMATTDLNKVPATILSRAQLYTFKLAEPKTILAHLKMVCTKEKIDIDTGALEIVVMRGGGSFRDSLSLLDQISTLSSTKITQEMVESAMGLPQDAKIIELLDSYRAKDFAKTTFVLKDLFNSGVRAEIIASDLISAIIENPEPETLALLGTLPDVKEPFSEARLVSALLSSCGQQNPAPSSTAKDTMSTSIQTPTPHPQNTPKPQDTSKMSKFEKFIFERNKVKQDASNADGLATASTPKNNEIKSKISAIMGGEVEEYGGGNPF